MGFVDRYLEALVARDPSRLPLAKDTKFTMGTMREFGDLVMMALRLRIRWRRVSEIETVFYREGSGPAWNEGGMEQLDHSAQIDSV